MQRCEEGRGLTGLEDCVQVEVNSLEKYLITSKEKTLKEVSRIKIIENNKYGKATDKVRGKRSWSWLKKGYFKKETESTIEAAQDQALCTRNMINMVYRENVQPICPVCGAANETVAHIVSECSRLAQKELKQVRHDNVVKMLHC